MSHLGIVGSVLLAILVASVADAQSPNEFYKRGVPTLVRGTAGSELTTKALAAQAELFRVICFPTANVIDDKGVDATKGAAAWPANPVLIGSNESNAVLAALGE